MRQLNTQMKKLCVARLFAHASSGWAVVVCVWVGCGCWVGENSLVQLDLSRAISCRAHVTEKAASAQSCLQFV